MRTPIHLQHIPIFISQIRIALHKPKIAFTFFLTHWVFSTKTLHFVHGSPKPFINFWLGKGFSIIFNAGLGDYRPNSFVFFKLVFSIGQMCREVIVFVYDVFVYADITFCELENDFKIIMSVLFDEVCVCENWVIVEFEAKVR